MNTVKFITICYSKRGDTHAWNWRNYIPACPLLYHVKWHAYSWQASDCITFYFLSCSVQCGGGGGGGLQITYQHFRVISNLFLLILHFAYAYCFLKFCSQLLLTVHQMFQEAFLNDLYNHLNLRTAFL